MRCLCCLTFELRGRNRDGALAARPMINSTDSRPGCHAGGGPWLERRVRQHLSAGGSCINGYVGELAVLEEARVQVAGAICEAIEGDVPGGLAIAM